MKAFLNEDFLLHTETARYLYHEHAAVQPIIDYHNHLPPSQLAEDRIFSNLTEIWLQGDHYKWRAMRANGIPESFITGDRSDEEKFHAWARTVPYTLRNPLYHWTHLELQRYFNIRELLNEKSAGFIYETCNSLLATRAYSARNLLTRMNVEVVCTTDDPCDDLGFHRQLAGSGYQVRVLPTFRPDAALAIDNPDRWKTWMQKLSDCSGIRIDSWESFLVALKSRHDFFASYGCRLSDHGVERMYYAEADEITLSRIFKCLLSGQLPVPEDAERYKTAVLLEVARWNHEKDWAMQWHIGPIRNNNSRLASLMGADAGADSIGDFSTVREMSRFFDRLDRIGQLPRSIIYNINPAWNEVYATMTGNFQDGSIPGKMQFGSAWWFLDQKDGMEKQLNALSNMGLLSRFVGMLTDSRSFLSFPRHEYFRRILCNLLGDEMEKGELPNDRDWLGSMVEDICYGNARRYFGFPLPG